MRDPQKVFYIDHTGGIPKRTYGVGCLWLGAWMAKRFKQILAPNVLQKQKARETVVRRRERVKYGAIEVSTKRLFGEAMHPTCSFLCWGKEEREEKLPETEREEDQKMIQLAIDLDYSRTIMSKVREIMDTKEKMLESYQKLKSLLELTRRPNIDIELNFDCLIRLNILWNACKGDAEKEALQGWLQREINRLLPFMYRIPLGPERDFGPLHLLMDLLPQREPVAALRRARAHPDTDAQDENAEVVVPKKQKRRKTVSASRHDCARRTARTEEQPSPLRRCEETPIELETELVCLADLLEIYPEDEPLWHLLGAALVDQTCFRSQVKAVWNEDRLRWWEDYFFQSGQRDLCKFGSLSLEVYATWVLILAVVDPNAIPGLLSRIEGRSVSEGTQRLRWPNDLLQRAIQNVPNGVPSYGLIRAKTERWMKALPDNYDQIFNTLPRPRHEGN